MKTIFNIAIALFFMHHISYAQDVMLIMGPDLERGELAYAELKEADLKTSTAEDANLTGQHLSYHESGLLESKGTYYKGQKNGLWMSWSKDGAPLNQAYFTNGQKDGTWKVWDENGTLRYVMYYKNGDRVKTWQVFDETGNLIEEKAY